MKQLRPPCEVPEGAAWAKHDDACTCSPYRPLYDASKAHDAGRELTPIHIHNRALRRVAKEILKDLWRASRDWHQDAR